MKNRVRLIILAMWAAGLFPALVSAPAGASVQMTPHRAVYDMILVSAKSGSGVSSVSGEMLAEWSKSCDGWALDHRTLFDITYIQGGTVRLTSSVATWESRDGLQYHFDITNAASGKVTEKYEGRGQLSETNGVGRVDYIVPQREPLKLAAGTVFPMAHTARVLAATQSAPTIRSMIVFDGMSKEGTFLVSAVIGNPTAPSDTSMEGLRTHRAWPLQLAYFSTNGREAEPEHEVGMQIFDNGVSDVMVLDFGEFKVKADLKRLEYSKPPVCDGK